MGLLYLTVFSTSSSAKRLHVPEPVLEKALADTLGVEIQELTEELVAQKLRYLDASNRQLRDLTGLEVAQNLEVLVLKQNLIEDITPLASLPNLTKLDLSGNRISNLSALQGLSLEKMKSELSRLQLALQSRTLTKAEKAGLVLELAGQAERSPPSAPAEARCIGRHDHLTLGRDDRLARPLVHLVVPPLHLLDNLRV